MSRSLCWESAAILGRVDRVLWMYTAAECLSTTDLLLDGYTEEWIE